VGLLRNAVWIWLWGYRRLISPANGESCTLYPSCSTYAAQAVGRHGPLLGGWMAAARVTRDHRDPAYPECSAGGQIYRYDPVEADAWWRSSR
jgi:putative component of membrane protein insertase Oxa1/YidC/SpoIIIJ protein YidD